MLEQRFPPSTLSLTTEYATNQTCTILDQNSCIRNVFIEWHRLYPPSPRSMWKNCGGEHSKQNSRGAPSPTPQHPFRSPGATFTAGYTRRARELERKPVRRGGRRRRQTRQGGGVGRQEGGGRRGRGHSRSSAARAAPSVWPSFRRRVTQIREAVRLRARKIEATRNRVLRRPRRRRFFFSFFRVRLIRALRFSAVVMGYRRNSCDLCRSQTVVTNLFNWLV